MAPSPRIVAHIIIGARQEPYLRAVLESIAGVCTCIVVNDNSGITPGPNEDILRSSSPAADGRLIVVRTSFSGFGDARNACIDATPPDHRNGWVLFVDADEVHGHELQSMSALLPKLPDDVDAVDGYSRHFVGSFSWWKSVDRRLCFFRFHPGRRWRGRIHEQLEPVGRRIALPCVWAHYGHVVTPVMEWQKSRLYSSLGQPGFAPTDAELAAVDASQAWGHMRADVMRYRGNHPPAAQAVIAELSQRWAGTFADLDAIFSDCSAIERLRRGVRRANYARLIAFREIEAIARWGWSA
jgi:hypothetical protein